jgi:hypothetical protein
VAMAAAATTSPCRRTLRCVFRVVVTSFPSC